MKAKTSRNANGNASAASAADFSPWATLGDLGRQQLALATDSAAALFRGSEAIRRIQEQAAHLASAQHAAAARKLHSPCQADTLLGIQMELTQFDLQAGIAYWQQLAAAAAQTQTELLACAAQWQNGSSDQSFTPALQAWNSAVAAALDGAARQPRAH